jgi:hypothetical protein
MGCVVAGGVYVVAVVPPTDATFFPKCHFHQLTGLHCPGCGVTRALHAALNGHVTQALAYNLLAPLLIPVIGVMILRVLWAWLWDKSTSSQQALSQRWMHWMPWVLLGVLITFGVLRNIPYYPFNLLAPHELTR